jgi:hypothetical protein
MHVANPSNDAPGLPLQLDVGGLQVASPRCRDISVVLAAWATHPCPHTFHACRGALMLVHACLASVQDDSASAAAHLTLALKDAHNRVGHTQLVGQVLNMYGPVQGGKGDASGARTMLGSAEQLLSAVGDLPSLITTHSELVKLDAKTSKEDGGRGGGVGGSHDGGARCANAWETGTSALWGPYEHGLCLRGLCFCFLTVMFLRFVASLTYGHADKGRQEAKARLLRGVRKLEEKMASASSKAGHKHALQWGMS